MAQHVHNLSTLDWNWLWSCNSYIHAPAFSQDFSWMLFCKWFLVGVVWNRRRCLWKLSTNFLLALKSSQPNLIIFLCFMDRSSRKLIVLTILRKHFTIFQKCIALVVYHKLDLGGILNFEPRLSSFLLQRDWQVIKQCEFLKDSCQVSSASWM